ncbi:MAG: ATP-binding cassette domain-containing protein, partial [Staphylococcus hominis]
LERTHLTDFADRQIGQLSGGQKKRAFVARGIAQGASIMLLDEPFAGVDKQSEATITALLRELVDEGTTLFVSTHDFAALPALAEESVLLNKRVLMHAPTEDVLRPENLARGFGMTPTHTEEHA